MQDNYKQLKEQVGQKWSTVGTHRNVDCWKTRPHICCLSIENSKHFDDISFRELFVKISGFFYKI